MSSQLPFTSNMMTLICQVFGDQDSFPIDISGDKLVGHLKELIHAKKNITFRGIEADKLKLWKWNRPDDEINDSELGDQDKLSARKTLNQVFGNGAPNPEFIHIIIKADILPTVIKPVHPNPLRRKRFDDINNILSKCKKQKKDKPTIAYSSVSWSEIESVYAQIIKEVDLKPRTIPDQIVDVLYNNLRTISRALGDILTGKEAKRLYFIGAILFYFVAITEGDGTDRVDILIEESVTGENINVEGRFEFVIKRGNKKICIVEAKKDDLEQGMTQDLLGCEAIADIESSSCVYGIVTTYLNWVFFRSLDDRIERDTETLADKGENTIKEGLKRVLGKIYALLFDKSE